MATRPTALATTSGLAHLAASAGAVFRVAGASPAETHLERLRRAVAEALTDPHLLPESLTVAPPSGFAKYLLHSAPDLAVFATVTAPGFVVHAHDHGGWGVVGLYRGDEEEVRYKPATPGPGLVETGRDRYGPGQVMVVPPPPADIHQVHNRGAGPTVSVHVFGEDPLARGFLMYPPPDFAPVHTGPMAWDELPTPFAR